MTRTTKGLGLFLAVALLPLGVACGPSSPEERVTLDADSLCDRRINTCMDTSVTLDGCKRAYSIMTVTQDCAEALNSASCQELLADDSRSANLCFPKCQTAAKACNGDGTLSECAQLGSIMRVVVVDCAALCESGQVAGASKFTGVCGKTYKDTNVAAEDTCWCE